METSNLSDNRVQKNDYKDAQETKWELQLHEKGYRSHKIEPLINEEYDIWNENTLEEMNSRLDEAKDQIGNLEDRQQKKHNQRKRKKKKNFTKSG